jgi:hypothetical protein
MTSFLNLRCRLASVVIVSLFAQPLFAQADQSSAVDQSLGQAETLIHQLKTEGSSSSCQAGFSMDKVMSDTTLGFFDPGAKDLLWDLNSYYTDQALLTHNATACSALAALPQSRAWVDECTKFYHEYSRWGALITGDPRFDAICREGSKMPPAETAQSCQGLQSFYKGQLSALDFCKSINATPIKIKKCETMLAAAKGSETACADPVWQGVAPDTTCSAVAHFALATKHRNAELCGSSIECRVLFGQRQADNRYVAKVERAYCRDAKTDKGGSTFNRKQIRADELLVMSEKLLAAMPPKSAALQRSRLTGLRKELQKLTKTKGAPIPMKKRGSGAAETSE